MMITEFGLDTVNAERLRGPSFLLMICDSFDYHAPIVGLLISQPERSCLSIRNRISSIAINDRNFICQILACFKLRLPGKHYPRSALHVELVNAINALLTLLCPNGGCWIYNLLKCH